MIGTYPNALFDLLCIVGVALLLYQQHQLRRDVRASTPYQLGLAVKAVKEQMDLYAALLDTEKLQEISNTLARHERKIDELDSRVAKLEQAKCETRRLRVVETAD